MDGTNGFLEDFLLLEDVGHLGFEDETDTNETKIDCGAPTRLLLIDRARRPNLQFRLSILAVSFVCG